MLIFKQLILYIARPSSSCSIRFHSVNFDSILSFFSNSFYWINHTSSCFRFFRATERWTLTLKHILFKIHSFRVIHSFICLFIYIHFYICAKINFNISSSFAFNPGSHSQLYLLTKTSIDNERDKAKWRAKKKKKKKKEERIRIFRNK